MSLNEGDATEMVRWETQQAPGMDFVLPRPGCIGGNGNLKPREAHAPCFIDDAAPRALLTQQPRGCTHVKPNLKLVSSRRCWILSPCSRNPRTTRSSFNPVATRFAHTHNKAIKANLKCRLNLTQDNFIVGFSPLTAMKEL